MASIFEQYQTTLTKEASSAVPEISGGASGYVSLQATEQQPMFKRQRLNLQNLQSDVLHVCAANNWLIVLTSDQVVFRLNLSNPAQFDDLLVEKYIQKATITGMYLDPQGVHILITLGAPKGQTSSPGVVYLQRSSTKARLVTRFKDHNITAVAFNWDNKSELTTGMMLFGTNKGQIFESEVGMDSEKSLTSIKPIFEIDGKPCITGIGFFRAPDTKNYIVIVTTFDRLYKFHETVKPESKITVATQIFSPYLNIREEVRDVHIMDTKGFVSRMAASIYKDFPTAVGWLTDAGVLYLSDIDRKAGSAQFVGNIELIPIPADEEAVVVRASYKSEKKLYPKSLLLTDYHVLLLFHDRITAVSILNYQIVYEEYFHEQHGNLLDLTKDPLRGTVYLYTNKSVFLYKINNEGRNVWRLYLEKNEFALALSHCQEQPIYRDIVLTKQAEDYFAKKNYMQAARVYSETQRSFEEVCLKFYELNENQPLICYLNNRFLKLNSTDKTQITMLTLWLIELYLTEMSKLSPASREYGELHSSLDRFIQLGRVTECIRNNRTVVQELVASHGDIYDLSSLKTVNQNVDNVVALYINQENYTEAINVMRTSGSPELIYKFSPILMEELPMETVALFKRLSKRLDPAKLIPSLSSLKAVQYVGQVIEYLEFIVYSLGNATESVHNYLILLYAKHNKDKLLTYLESQGKERTMIQYDIYFAVRTAKEYEVKSASVYLYCMLGLWQKAVKLALEFDEELAERTANEVKSVKLRKQLWLQISKYQIERQEKIGDGLDLLKKCDLLRMEDILPFFPDFMEVDDFKDAVMEALEQYAEELDVQKKEMHDAMASAENVRNGLEGFHNRMVSFSSNDQCYLCQTLLLTRPFFFFICGHKFHSDCLETQVLSLISDEQMQRLNLLKSQLFMKDTGEEGVTQTREEIKEEIETILAGHCVMCGDVMIDALDKQFDTDWDDKF